MSFRQLFVICCIYMYMKVLITNFIHNIFNLNIRICRSIFLFIRFFLSYLLRFLFIIRLNNLFSCLIRCLKTLFWCNVVYIYLQVYNYVPTLSDYFYKLILILCTWVLFCVKNKLLLLFHIHINK